MSGTGDVNTSSPTKETNPLARSLAIDTESPYLGEKSQKSIKSPIGISGGVSQFRSSIGMFNLDLAQDLATMEKKKEKLEELVAVMKNKKERIMEKEQQLGSEINRKSELDSRIRILEEQKVARNMGQVMDPKIREIEERVGAIANKELELQQSIHEISLSLKSRRAEEDEEVQLLIKQTNELNNEMISSDKQLNLAKSKIGSEISSRGDKYIEETIELQNIILQLEQSASAAETQLKLSLDNKHKSAIQLQQNTANSKNKLQQLRVQKQELDTRIKGLEGDKASEADGLETLKREESKGYEHKLGQIRTKNESLKGSGNSVTANSLSKLREEEEGLLKEIKSYEERSSGIDAEKIKGELESVAELKKQLSENNEDTKHHEEENFAKAKEIHEYTALISKLNSELKQMAEESNAMAKKREDAAHVLLQEKSKYEISLKDNELHELHNDLDKLKRKVTEEKTAYAKLEALNKDFVPLSMIQEYKNKNTQYTTEVKDLTTLKNNTEAMTKEVHQLREEKSTLEWADNQIALDLNNSIKALKNKKGNVVADTKDLQKKINLAETKIKEYVETYPTFQIKIEKKGAKKKNIEVSVAEKQVKEIQSPTIPEPKKVEKVEAKKREEEDQIEEVTQEKQTQKVDSSPQAKPSTGTKSKKNKKKTTEGREEQTLIEQILERQSETQQILKRQSESPQNKKKKGKKEKATKVKKSEKSEEKSNIEVELEYLNQSTREERKGNVKIPQVLGLLIAVLGGAAYWLSS